MELRTNRDTHRHVSVEHVDAVNIAHCECLISGESTLKIWVWKRLCEQARGNDDGEEQRSRGQSCINRGFSDEPTGVQFPCGRISLT